MVCWGCTFSQAQKIGFWSLPHKLVFQPRFYAEVRSLILQLQKYNGLFTTFPIIFNSLLSVQFSRDLKSLNNGYAKLFVWGVGRGRQTKCIIGNLEVVNYKVVSSASFSKRPELFTKTSSNLTGLCYTD